MWRSFKSHFSKLLFICVFVAGWGAGFAQIPVLIGQNDLSGIEKITTNVYPSDGLWGYINGGADLYLEYGFEELISQRITMEGKDYVADIYRMATPQAAFGIFSAQRYKCLQTNVLSSQDCHTAFQYLAAKNQYLISIVNPTGLEEHRRNVVGIAGAITSRIEELPFVAPYQFQSVVFQQSIQNIKYVSGPLGLQNAFPSWEGFFEGIDTFSAWILPLENQQGRGEVARVELKDATDYNRFIRSNNLYPNENQVHQAEPAKGLHVLKHENNVLWLARGHVDGLIQQTLKK